MAESNEAAQPKKGKARTIDSAKIIAAQMEKGGLKFDKDKEGNRILVKI